MSDVSDNIDWDALESQLDQEVPSVVDVSSLSNSELLLQFHETTEQLRKRHEMLRPNTPEGRDLHSLRAALKILLVHRGMM